MKNYQITLTSFIWSLYQRTDRNYSISVPYFITNCIFDTYTDTNNLQIAFLVKENP